MNWFRKISGRGLYNTQQEDTHRSRYRGFGGVDPSEADRYRENDIVEGEHVNILKRMFKEKNFNAFNEYVMKLKNMGFSKGRVDSMVNRAMHGVRI